jgi:hypothetical protein
VQRRRRRLRRIIDKTGAMPPADSVGACNVPPNRPRRDDAVQGGHEGVLGGVVVCQGSVGPTGATDSCGDDSNCDGVAHEPA